MQAAHGVTGKRKFALAAVLTFILFAGFLATAQRARADTGSPDPNTAGEVAAPPSQDNSTTPQTTTDQQSTTDQTANPTATAAQPQQTNVVIIIRVNSPGDDVVTQTNIVSVVAVGSNQSSTTQNSGLPGSSAAGTDASTGSSDPTGMDGQTTDVQPTEGQAAPVPGAAPQRSQPAPAGAPTQVPSGVQQPANQPAQAAAAAAAPQRPGALAILASSVRSTANREAPTSPGGSPTMSAKHLRRGGARGRSDASASRPSVGVQASGFAAKPTSTGKVDGKAKSANLHASNAATLAAKDAGPSWLDRARFTPPTPVAANDQGSGTNLGLTTLTALLVGLIGWMVFTWFGARGSPWRRAGG